MTNIKLIIFVQALVVVVFIAIWLCTVLFTKTPISFKALPIAMGIVFLLSLFTIYVACPLLEIYFFKLFKSN